MRKIAFRFFTPLLLVCLCAVRAFAEDSGAKAETVTLPAPSNNAKQDSTDAAAAAADPVLGLLEKYKNRPRDNENAQVIDLGSGGVYYPQQGSAAWTLPAEEAGPRGRAGARAETRPGDPEWRRSEEPDGARPEAVAPAPPPPAAPKPSRAAQAGDPETRFREMSAQDELSNPPAAPLAPPAGLPVKNTADAPRYPSGEGLDSAAAEELARLVQAERETKAKAAATPLPSPRPPAPPAPVRTTETEKKPQEADFGEEVSGDDGVPPRKNEPGQKKGPLDPNESFQAVMKTVRENNRRIEEAHKAQAQVNRQPQDKPADDSEIHTRTPQAAHAYEALRGAPLGAVSCRVFDAVTHRPLPARMRVLDATDVPAQAPLSCGSWCEGGLKTDVVSGWVKVEVSHGRFWPVFTRGLEVKPGLTAALDAPLAQPRTLDFAARGWYLADFELNVRARPGEQNLWLGDAPTLDDLVLAARAEGVQILGVPLPPAGRNPAPFNRKDLARVQSDDLLVLPVFPGPRNPFNGEAFGLGLRSFDDLPANVNAPGTPLRETFDEIHARDGLAVFTRLEGLRQADLKRDIFPLFPGLREQGSFPESGSLRLYGAHELPFDTVTGPAYDAFAFDGSELAERFWFNLLNQGYAIQAIGAGGGSLEGGRVPFGQTFLQLPGKPTAANVMEALRKGRTSISFGPAVFCRVIERDMGPGAVLPADGRALTLQVQAAASNAKNAQIGRVELLRNGVVVMTHKASGGETYIQDLRWPLSEKGNAWYSVRVSEAADGQPLRQGWTSPFYFRTAGFAPPKPAHTHLTGTLRRGHAAVAGSITVLVPGQAPQNFNTDASGRFKLDIPASATLVFETAGCEPRALRLFEHPAVRKALAALQTERSGPLMPQLAKPVMCGEWRLLLSELEWTVELTPLIQSRSAP